MLESVSNFEVASAGEDESLLFRLKPTRAQLAALQGPTVGAKSPELACIEIKKYLASTAGKTFRQGERVLRDFFPETLREFVPEADRDWVGALSIQSTKKMPIQRECGHLFRMPVVKAFDLRNATFGLCPECQENRRAQRSFGTLASTALQREWDEESNRKAGIDPFEIQCGDNKEKPHWIHAEGCGRPWRATVANRMGQASSCPNCNIQTSLPSISIFCELQALGLTVKREVELPSVGFIDMVIFTADDKSVAIEYDGLHSHRKTVDRDRRKTQRIEECHDLCVRIRHNSLPVAGGVEILYSDSDSTGEIVAQLLQLLRPYLQAEDKGAREKIEDYVSERQVIATNQALELHASLSAPNEKYPSLRSINKKAADDFDACINVNRALAKNVRAQSPRVAFFRCSNCNESYRRERLCISSSFDTCPYCSRRIIVQGLNDLSISHPGLHESIVLATQRNPSGPNSRVDLGALHKESTARVERVCADCDRLIGCAEVRDAVRGKSKCICKKRGGKSLSDIPELQKIYMGGKPIREVTVGTRDAHLFKCSGDAGSSVSPDCELTVSRAVKSVVSRFEKSGSLPLCAPCFSRKRSKNFPGRG